MNDIHEYVEEELRANCPFKPESFTKSFKSKDENLTSRSTSKNHFKKFLKS